VKRVKKTKKVLPKDENLKKMKKMLPKDENFQI